MPLLLTNRMAKTTGVEQQSTSQPTVQSVLPTLDLDNPLSPYPYLTVSKLRSELKERSAVLSEEMMRLLTQVCDCSDKIWHEPTDDHEWRARLRYRVPEAATRVLKLAPEWVRILRLRKDYLMLAPPNVQEEFASIKWNVNIRSVSKQGSLVAFIKKRNDDDRDMWNASIADRNARCGWDLNIEIATTASIKPVVHSTANKHQLKKTAGSKVASKIASSTKKRGYEIVDHSGSDEEALPRKRIQPYPPTHASHSSRVQMPSAQQTPATRPLTSHPNGDPSSTPGFTYSTMPIGKRIGFRPEKGSSSFPYEWSHGRKRAHLYLSGHGQSLPDVATTEHFNSFSSACTYEHVDIRLL